MQNGGNISFEVQWRLDNDNRNRIVLRCYEVTPAQMQCKQEQQPE